MQASSTNNTKDSAGRRLGVKKLGGMEVFPGDILVRQRGMKWHAGENTYVGKDHTIHSKIEGTVYFTSFQQNFHRGAKSIIHVRP
jgi:large subunit ribosomal protein L27